MLTFYVILTATMGVVVLFWLVGCFFQQFVLLFEQ